MIEVKQTMKEALLTTLRNKHTRPTEFRCAADKLAELLAAEVALQIEQEEISIETPLGPTTGYQVKGDIILVPILRAGLALLTPFLRLFNEAKVGFFGIRRDEATAYPELYYEILPRMNGHETILLLDPMIATAGSALLSIDRLVAKGIPASSIKLVGVISAPEGIEALHSQYPDVGITVVAQDERLNAQKFIVPGLGDFGDRYFGTC
jgi:uracil phosphoribosyltransferase